MRRIEDCEWRLGRNGEERNLESGELLRDLFTINAVWRVGFVGGRIAAVFFSLGGGGGNVAFSVGDFLINDHPVVLGDVEESTDLFWDIVVGRIGRGRGGFWIRILSRRMWFFYSLLLYALASERITKS